MPEISITLETSTGSLKGSLNLPLASKKTPVVLIIAGSGPTDRDGNLAALSTPNNCLKMLAEALAASGFPSVRYDKRGIGESVKTAEADLRFESYIEDAIAWVNMLKSDGRFSGVVVVGHSEGSLIGILASRATSASAFVSIAGPAERASSLLRKQLAGKLSEDLEKRSEAILSALERAELIEDIPFELNILYRKSVQPYLISWFNYVPTNEISRLTIPTLVIQGDTDIQVDVSQALALKAANTDAELVVIHGMNHVCKLVSPNYEEQQNSYGDPSLPVATLLIKKLTRFLDRIVKI